MAADWEAQAGTDQPLHTLRTRSQGSAAGGCFRICLHGPFLPEEPPEWTWPTGLRSSWPGQVLQLHITQLGPGFPGTYRQEFLTTVCLGCHGLHMPRSKDQALQRQTVQQEGPGRLNTASLRDNRSCPHPPPLGSPSKRPLFPGPLRVEGWPVRLKQKSLGPFLFSPP